MRKIFFIAVSLFFFIATSFVSNASTLFFMPQNAEYQESETFIKTFQIDTNDQEVNAIESKINFDQNILEAVDVITGDSVIKLWTKKPLISNSEGSIEFGGGVPGGHKGSGVILKIIFKAKKTGDFTLNLSEIKVLLNNGEATEDELLFLDNNYKITEKSDSFIKIISASHPNQDEWQNNNTLSFHWDLVDKTQYSYILSRDPLAEPDKIPNSPEGKLVWMGDMSYKGLSDDIYYFHLKQKLPNKEWSPKITMRAMIDITNPEEFALQAIDIEGEKYLIFSTTDATSGIDHYEISESSTEWKIIKSPYLIADQNSKSSLKIKAVDKAGNERFSEIILSSNPKLFTKQLVFVMLLFVIIIIIIIITNPLASKLFLRKNKNKK